MLSSFDDFGKWKILKFNISATDEPWGGLISVFHLRPLTLNLPGLLLSRTVRKAFNLQKILSWISQHHYKGHADSGDRNTNGLSTKSLPSCLGKDVKHFTNLIYGVQEKTPDPVR